MDIRTNIPLAGLTTMKLGGPARFFAEAHSPIELQQLYQMAVEKKLPIFILGGGSNLIVHDEGFNGLVIRIKIPGFAVVADELNATTISVGAGEPWDETVRKTVEMGLSGIEALSGIPGSTGAAPVQNIGAYGQEIGDTLVSVAVYDTQTNTFATLSHDDCEFSYRNSIFKSHQAGRYIITGLTIKLSKNLPAPPFYESLQAYLDEHAIQFYTHQTIRNAVLAVRTEKLPDPKTTPSAGSFFKNAFIETWQLNELLTQYPTMKHYDMGNGTAKIPAGWLIDMAGFKGSLLHGMRVYEKNALVLVNESASGYKDLAAARDEITGKIRDTFRIILEQEPLEV